MTMKTSCSSPTQWSSRDQHVSTPAATKAFAWLVSSETACAIWFLLDPKWVSVTRRERVERDTGFLGGVVGLVGIRAEQVEKAPAFWIDRSRERQRGGLGFVLRALVDFHADAFGLVERLGERAADRKASLRQEMHRTEQVDRAFAARHLPESRLRPRGAGCEGRDRGRCRKATHRQAQASSSTHSTSGSMPPSSPSSSQR